MTPPAARGEPSPSVLLAVLLGFPFRGRWQARNSPARRVPSHGSDLFATTFAIDFVAVDEHGRSASRTWRSILGTEPPESFVGFGQPILAPVAGTVVARHDGEPDHAARRSLLTLLPYLLGQAKRARRGVPGLAGNHVVISAGPDGPFVLLAHLRCGSVRVELDEVVRLGQPVGACGNSGNSTEPHVHVQAADSLDWERARGLPIAFGSSREDAVLPAEAEIVQIG